MASTAFRNEAATLFLAGHRPPPPACSPGSLFAVPGAGGPARAGRGDAALAGAPRGWPTWRRLPYIRAVVEEALRLYPPVPLLARQAQADLTVAGHAVARGDLVMVVPWLLHRHRRWWDRPDEFRPERFLAGAPDRPRHAYVPFSLGPRVCTGMAFGLAEAVIILATLLPAFRLRLAPGARVWPVCRLTLRPGDALPMLLETRPAGNS